MLSVMNTKKIVKLQARIQGIKKNISELDEMRPGSLSKQFNVCGNPNCRCKDAQNPQKHGPYFQLSYTRKGKSTTEFVRKELLMGVRKQLQNYQTFKKLYQEWIDLTIEISKLRREQLKSK